MSAHVFTFHNVSINTNIEILTFCRHVHLHSTMFLLIPDDNPNHPKPRLNLHSTMFLLILSYHRQRIRQRKWFTFHNVSINTAADILFDDLPDKFTFHNVSINTAIFGKEAMSGMYLHSTMFLLIHLLTVLSCLSETHLHSTMFLLIQKWRGVGCCGNRIYIPQCFY